MTHQGGKSFQKQHDFQNRIHGGVSLTDGQGIQSDGFCHGVAGLPTTGGLQSVRQNPAKGIGTKHGGASRIVAGFQEEAVRDGRGDGVFKGGDLRSQDGVL